jgi:hypothetical protein
MFRDDSWIQMSIPFELPMTAPFLDNVRATRQSPMAAGRQKGVARMGVRPKLFVILLAVFLSALGSLSPQAVNAAAQSCGLFGSQVESYLYGARYNPNIGYALKGTAGSIPVRVSGLCYAGLEEQVYSLAWVMLQSTTSTDGYAQIGYINYSANEQYRFFYQTANLKSDGGLVTSYFGTPVLNQTYGFKVNWNDSTGDVHLYRCAADGSACSQYYQSGLNPSERNWGTTGSSYAGEVSDDEADLPGSANYRTNFTLTKQRTSIWAGHALQKCIVWLYNPDGSCNQPSANGAYHWLWIDTAHKTFRIYTDPIARTEG